LPGAPARTRRLGVCRERAAARAAWPMDDDPRRSRRPGPFPSDARNPPMKEAIAVYPGTFDPFTRGHEDLVRRGSRLFNRIIVGIARSRGKTPLFDLEERIEIAREVCAPFPNVEVRGFDGLLMNFL